MPTSWTVPILTYHRVADDASGPIAPFSVTPSTFVSHLDLISRLGFITINATALNGTLRDHGRPDERCVVLTFDDGFRDNRAAFEELARRQMSATLFVCTGLLEGVASDEVRLGPMLRPAELVEVRSLGADIGSHGTRHRELDLERTPAVRHDLVRSKELLSEWVGAAVETFAYPYGYHRKRTQELVRESGYSSAFGVGNRLASSNDSRWARSRLLVRSDTSEVVLRSWLEGHIRQGSGHERPATTIWRAVRWARHARQTSPPSEPRGT